MHLALIHVCFSFHHRLRPFSPVNKFSCEKKIRCSFLNKTRITNSILLFSDKLCKSHASMHCNRVKANILKISFFFLSSYKFWLTVLSPGPPDGLPRPLTPIQGYVYTYLMDLKMLRKCGRRGWFPRK